ncbi:hypothetical protein NL676_000146 [Syzygium grande]|nr:hypothetical protein NL676_000146 [Syzygium grande]
MGKAESFLLRNAFPPPLLLLLLLRYATEDKKDGGENRGGSPEQRGSRGGRQEKQTLFEQRASGGRLSKLAYWFGFLLSVCVQ